MSGSKADQALFHFVMIKPTHYDDDGYPIQWLRSAIPSNTLACLNALAEDAARRAFQQFNGRSANWANTASFVCLVIAKAQASDARAGVGVCAELGRKAQDRE